MKHEFQAVTSQIRKKAAQNSLKYFAKKYFPHYCKLEYASFHLELFGLLEEVTEERGKQLAVAAPRGNAKSSIVSTIFLLWCICYEREECVVIFSNTKEQAEKILRNLKEEIEKNELLRQDFPDVCEMPNPRWRNEEITTRNGVNISVSSTLTKVRGLRNKENRPSLVILDDVESEENTRTEEGREKIYEWFTRLVLNLGDKKTNYIAVGTILHFDSLLAKLTSAEEFPGFDKRIYKSVIQFAERQDLWDRWNQIFWGREKCGEETGPAVAERIFKGQEADMLRGTKVLWPEKESYYDLMVMKAQKGDLSFESEKQNEPRDMSTFTVDLKTIRYWEDDHLNIGNLEKLLKDKKMVFGAIDPSVGKTTKSDLSAIVTVYMDRSSKIFYVVGVETGRWDLKTIMEKIRINHETFMYGQFIYENNAAQEWLGQALRESRLNIPLKPMTNLSPKENRILRLITLIQNGRVVLSRRSAELIRELSYYPRAKNDDAIDALATVVEAGLNVKGWDIEKIAESLNIVVYGTKTPSPEIKTYGGKPFPDHKGMFNDVLNRLK